MMPVSGRGAARQRGISLISLMIGLLVSLLAVLGMMALYRTVMHTTTESAAYARLSGDRSAALLAAHGYLQEAGFGIEDAAPGTDVGICAASTPGGQLRGGSCAASGTGAVLLWRVDDGALRCAGLHVTAAGGLEYLPPQACGGGLSGAAWPVAQRRVLFDPGTLAGGFTALELVQEPCQALGVAGEGVLRVRMHARHPVGADAAGNESVPVVSSSCLVNFR